METKQSRISLWPRTAHATGKRFHVGVIELTTELFEQLQIAYSQGAPLKLDVSVFENDSDHPKAPSRTGTVKLWQPPEQQQAAPKPAAKAQGDWEDIDF